MHELFPRIDHHTDSNRQSHFAKKGPPFVGNYRMCSEFRLSHLKMLVLQLFALKGLELRSQNYMSGLEGEGLM